MNQGIFRKIGVIAAAFFLAWAGIHYFLPLIAPFLLGWIFASMAEPMTKILHDRLRFNRILAAGIGVSLVLVVMVGLVWFVLALCYRELTALAAGIPAYAQALSGQVARLQEWAVGLASRAPGSLGEVLTRTVSGLFTEGSLVLEKVASGLISAAGNMAGKLPGGALMIGTAVISAYMISAQYPTLKRWIAGSGSFRRKWEPLLKNLWSTAAQWVKAQVKLLGVTFAIVTAGFLILRVDHWLIWAVVTALVDAVPMLGTGTVLIPMALFSFLWGEQVRGIGLIGLYLTAMLTRSALEPRLVGRQLGMNPLLTLIALYVGFRLWGVTGMILAPILAVTATRLIQRQE